MTAEVPDRVALQKQLCDALRPMLVDTELISQGLSVSDSTAILLQMNFHLNAIHMMLNFDMNQKYKPKQAMPVEQGTQNTQ